MTDLIAVLLLAGALLITGLIALFVYGRSHRKRKVDYHAFFILGVAFFPVGLALSMMNPGFIGIMALGIVYMSIGLEHKHEWKKKAKRKK